MIDGKKMRSLREARGMTQEQLASAVGVARQIITRAETGAKELSLAVAAAVARELGCKVDDLLWHNND